MTERQGLYLFIIRLIFFLHPVQLVGGTQEGFDVDQDVAVGLWLLQGPEKIWCHTFFQSPWRFWPHNVRIFENEVKAVFFHAL